MKNRRLKRDGGDWVETSFGQLSWFGGGVGGHVISFVGRHISKTKFFITKILAATAVLILIFTSFYLQIISGARYKARAETNRIRQIPIVAERGIIYDRNQKPLVTNVPSFYLAITTNDLPKDAALKKDLFKKISAITDLPAEDIEERLGIFSVPKYQIVPIKTNLTYEQAVKLEIMNNAYPCIRVETGLGRKYNIPQSLSHVVGFLRKVDKEDLRSNAGYLPTDDIGKTGIEKQYEKVLKGAYGKKQIEVDALGRQTAGLTKEDPIAGRDIILTIDSDLQKKSEDILKRHLRAHAAERGAVIISDIDNGEILTMVSLPAYDNNLFSGGLSNEDYEKLIADHNKPLFNRAIAGEYPSGSTVKPIFAAAALEEGIINQNTSFVSSGGIKIDQWFFPDWKTGGHGATNLRKALAESVNTFFYIIGGGLLDGASKNFIFEGLGVQRLTAYAKKFGLSNKLGIDLPNEAAGFLPSKEWKENTKKEAWYIGDTYHLAIGQGDLLVTPLQVNSWTGVFANGGILYKPRLAKTFVHPNGNLSAIEAEIINSNFLKKDTLEAVRQGLRDGVLYGTSSSLQELQVSAAGKTGTAQWGRNKRPHAWFTGFAPYNKPEVAITVLVEEGVEGSKIAISVAKEILWWYFLSAGHE